MSTATPIHYDKSDVFVIQIQGSKTWRIYKPVDILPNMRTPDISFAPDANTLEYFATYHLQAGDFLYLPRGWIHKVENETNAPSVHVSMVAFFDAWISIFGNLMADAYARLRGDLALRRHITPKMLQNTDSQPHLQAMMADFTQHFFTLAADGLQHYLDHCLNHQTYRERQAAARTSLAGLDDSDLAFSLSGVHYIVRENGIGQIGISVDNTNYYGVPRALFDMVKNNPGMTLESLAQHGSWDDETILHFVDVTVQQLGLFALHAVDTRHAAPMQATCAHTD